MIKATLREESFKLRLRGGRMANPHRPDLRALSVTAPRNDTAAVQLLLSADEAVSVCLTDAPHFSATPGAYRLRLQAAGDLPAELFELGMLPDDDGSEAADVLLPVDSFELDDGRPRCVYCRIGVPPDAAPGLHTVRLRLFGSELFGEEELQDEFTVEVTVARTALPERPTFRLDLWQHSSNVARHHDVRLWSGEHFAVLERYVRSLAALGQKSATVIVSEIPWRGQSCYRQEKNRSNLFEYSMVRTEWNPSAGFIHDFSAMDRYLDLCEQAGIAEEIEVFGLASVWTDPEYGFTGPVPEEPDSPRIRYWDRSRAVWRWMARAADVDGFLRALEAHFRETGRLERVRIASDEPSDPERYEACIARIRRLAPGFRFKTAINHAEFVERFRDSIDAFAPFLYCLSREWERLSECRAREPHKVFQWYLCCGPEWPNSFLRSHLLESRYIGIFTSFLGLDGFLRWNYTVWPRDPRREMRWGTFAAGDLNFVYPGADGTPLLSLRYEQLRRGIGDFELLEAAKRRGLSEAANRFYRRVIRERDVRTFFSEDGERIRPVCELCSLEYGDYAGARTEMLAALDAAP